MPIKGLSEDVRIPRLGKIHLGYRDKTEASQLRRITSSYLKNIRITKNWWMPSGKSRRNCEY